MPSRHAADGRTTRQLLADLDDAVAPLFELVSVPLTDDHKTQCPFHPDETPSLQVLRRPFPLLRLRRTRRSHRLAHPRRRAVARGGDRADPGLGRPGDAPGGRPSEKQDRPRARAVGPGRADRRHPGRALSRRDPRHRRRQLPANISDSLRFLARCPFGAGTAAPLPARAHARPGDRPADRDPAHRARAAGRQGLQARPLRPRPHRRRSSCGRPEPQLVVGEGLETTLAAATRIPYRGAPLQPAWSAVSSGGLSRLPGRSPGVERLIILVDHDGNGEGQAAAVRCMERWTRAGRTVVRLTPEARRRRFQRPRHAGAGVMSDDDLHRGRLGAVPGRARRDDRRLRRLPADARLHLHAVPGDVDRRRASMPACRACRCSPRAGKPKRDKNGKPITMLRHHLARPQSRGRADDLVPGLSHADQGSPGGRRRLDRTPGRDHASIITGRRASNRAMPARPVLGSTMSARSIPTTPTTSSCGWRTGCSARRRRSTTPSCSAARRASARTRLLEPVKHAVGPWNFHDIIPSQLLGRFNSFAKAVILRVNEARDLGDAERINRFNLLRPHQDLQRQLRPTCCASTRSICANTTSSTSSAS